MPSQEQLQLLCSICWCTTDKSSTASKLWESIPESADAGLDMAGCRCDLPSKSSCGLRILWVSQHDLPLCHACTALSSSLAATLPRPLCPCPTLQDC